ncbi:11259_t:CDS:1 [Paraglomus occultum]|uniref:11259_t:CDS:1 n=1 Tax=Paraglomus occultum TaxID=144539 RepID=A0A9N8W5R3_9GLOM|nr:11259_t:CDS:1 [Paraglomus occultum]
MTTLKLPLTRSLPTSSHSVPISLDKYLTREGHHLVVTYLKFNKVQKDIQEGKLNNLEEKDIDDLLGSYKGGPSHCFNNLNYDNLNLTRNELKVLAKILKADKLSNVRTLRICRNNLHGGILKTIIDVLSNNNTVEVLDLSFNAIRDADAKDFSRLLKKNKVLREIAIGHNRITAKGAQSIAKALKVNNSLVRLNIEANRLDIAGAAAIADIVAYNNSLKFLHIGGNNIQAGGMAAISEALKSNKILCSLSLDCNNIGSEGAFHLGEALKANSTLTHLYVSRNDIGNDGLQYLSIAMLSNRSLIYVDLELNCIGKNGNMNGVKALADLFDRHTVPRAINLKFNPIGDIGCQSLASGLYRNMTLESIILSSCDIGLQGIRALCDSLKENKGLQNISLSRNWVMGADGHQAVAEALEENTMLKRVQLDYDFEEWERISESIDKSLLRNHFLQAEKYSTACRLLVLSRLVIHATGKLREQKSHRVTEFLDLPFELKRNIMYALDTTNVLTNDNCKKILRLGSRRDNFNISKEGFLKAVFDVYYPNNAGTPLWPTGAFDTFVRV